MPIPAHTILVVEDEESFVDALMTSLKREGFRVFAARDGIEGLRMFEQTKPDLVLLDVMLPGLSGVDVCRQIRLKSRVPVIMLTARTSEIDTVVGLEVGADDYISKPYRMRELIARMRAVLRRVPVEDVTDSTEELQVGEVRLDPSRHEVTVRGELVTLPLKEFDLLEELLANAGRVMTRDLLIDRVWGPHYVGDTKTLDVHIKRLRSRLEDDPSNPKRIVTIRGLGYKYENR